MSPRVAAAALAIVAACTVDTETGIAAMIDTASVTVSPSSVPASTVVGLDLTMTFHVGEHAPGGDRMFVPMRAELYLEEGTPPIALLNLQRPADFDGTLHKGETRTVAFHGETLPGAYPPDPFCTGTPTIQVLVRYTDTTASEIGTTTATTTTVTCTP